MRSGAVGIDGRFAMLDQGSSPHRLLFHLARTGGTLISRCLGAMEGVCLLSEINPGAVSRFNPLRQAAQWHGLVADGEIKELADGDFAGTRQAIDLIAARAQQRGWNLVIRDWSHVDWIGFPFVRAPPLRFGWDSLGESNKQGVGGAVNGEAGKVGAVCRCATVRHPLDQYMSLRGLGVLREAWDETLVWQGIRRFAEAVQAMAWFRFEDFLAAPEETLQSVCAALALDYDPAWRRRWGQYTQVTGDAIDPFKVMIQPQPRRPVPSELWTLLRGNEDFQASLDLLGYSAPEPLRRRWSMGLSANASWRQGSNGGECSPPRRFTDVDDEVVRWRERFEGDDAAAESGGRLAEALLWAGQVQAAADLALSLVRHYEETPAEKLLPFLAFACDTLEAADRKFETLPLRRLWLRHEPDHMGNLFQMSLLLAGLGEIEESLAYSRHLLTLNQGNRGAAANYLLYSNYSDQLSAEKVSNEHFRLGMRFIEPPVSLPLRRREANEPIRIGYLSADFYTHPVGKIILPILQSHDRKRFCIHAYHDGSKSDASTVTIRQAVDRFTVVHGWSDQELTDAIRSDQIDVLIDLGGYTGGGNRLRVFSKRAAPVQASYLGYPHTSAIPAIDYHLTDHFADPPGITEHFYGERLVRLSHAHLAWHPYSVAEQVQVGERASHPVVGVFNNVAKISTSAIDAYAAILKRLPDARMILKYGDRYQVPALQDRYRREFAARGVFPDRLTFRTRSETLLEHLTTMASVDLALDSFPYQGTMTSLECLAVGTPIVSLCGEYYARRATSAMMMRLNLHELIASDPQEYVEIAVQLLGDLSVPRGLRREIVRRFHEGPLTDPSGLTRELEDVFQDWASGVGNQVVLQR